MMKEEEESEEGHWKNTLYLNILHRNHQETYPHLPIYQQYDQLWKKVLKFDEEREISNHIIYLLEHENHDFLQKKDYINALENVKQKIEFLHQHLQPISISSILPSSSAPASSSVNLSKLILEQKRILKMQSEELVVAKQELQKSIDIRVELEQSLTKVRDEYEQQIQSLQSKQTMQLEQEKLLETLKQENQFLTDRLKDEKDKAAKQLNEMNSFLEALRLKQSS